MLFKTHEVETYYQIVSYFGNQVNLNHEKYTTSRFYCFL